MTLHPKEQRVTIFESYPPNREWLGTREFVELELRKLLFFLMFNHRILRKIHLYYRTQSPSCKCRHQNCVSTSSSLAPVELILIFFVVRKGEFLDDVLGVNQTQKTDHQKRSVVVSMCQGAGGVAAQHGKSNCNSIVCCFCCPTMQLCGDTTGIVEVTVNRFVANVGIELSSRV